MALGLSTNLVGGVFYGGVLGWVGAKEAVSNVKNLKKIKKDIITTKNKIDQIQSAQSSQSSQDYQDIKTCSGHQMSQYQQRLLLL